MNEFDRHGAFAHARSDTLGRPVTNIAGYENTRDAGFEIEGIAIRGPSGRTPSFPHQMLAGNQIALRIPLDYSGEPIGAGNGARVD